tara:strand:+ start:111 stop:215 length:105 start_codon:yes stop_codon:yes gene_type:complete
MVQERDKKHLWWDACGFKVIIFLAIGLGTYFFLA